MDFALSTSWNAFRHKSGREMLFEIGRLGFDSVELSFNLEPVMVSEIVSLIKNSSIKVSSVHNYCPLPEAFSREKALPDCYSMSSLDEDERKCALKYTKRSIDSAVSLGAKAVVLHCGRVELKERTKVLISLYESGKKESGEFNKLRDDIIRERNVFANAYFEKTLLSLDELNSYAKEKGVLLGLETRYYYREIPSFEEIGLILKRFKGSNIFYWHDTGHAQLIENLKLGKHLDFLSSYAYLMLGIHLHDITGCRDHQAPGQGELDFKRLKPYLKQETIKVIEAHYPATPEELRKAKEFLSRNL
ncbi:MAG: TIM barrel protein [Candidatus Omnitrophota bacterium]|jgi:sugar phosphate isomerase/epimerase